jgi:hypothetical protein
MAYYTNYTLEIIPSNECLYQEFLDEGGFSDEDSCKWYDCSEDCERLSKQNPNHLIIVYAEGEKAGDIWKKAFLNGECVWSWALDTIVPPIPNEILEQIKND